MANETHDNSNQGWLLRFVKGMFIGSGFIIPGVSGGALAAIFGLYERIIRFLANITKNFKDNVIFFIPVGLGALASIVLLSFGISFVLENYETIVLWFFVGCIVGMVPSLWKEAGLEGRSQKDYMMAVVAFVFGIALIYFSNRSFGGQLPINFFSWVLCGALIALGVLVPGLSPSNFIVVFGLYQPLAEGFSRLDLSVLVPIAIGGLLTILLFSKIVEYIFEHYYSLFFHFIFGIVIASTIMIIPLNYAGFGWLQYFMCFVMLVAGTALGWWMSRLEEKYK